ncbi:MAG TPA: IPT/TIG domain-containing protein, partial [Actinomycetota bacterium]|nr:IPT/TIG domain-containing protein [Actinomycetota bacterium]
MHAFSTESRRLRRLLTALGLAATLLAAQFVVAAAVFAAAATIHAVGSEITATSSEQTTLAVSPAAAGNVLMLAVETKFTSGPSFTVQSVTGGGVSRWSKASSYFTLDHIHGQELWWGVVTTAGSSTINVAYSIPPSSSTATSLDLQEFSSSAGASTVWSVDATGKVDNGVASTTLRYPSLSPSSSSELYWGYLAVPGSLNAGATPGCSYQYDARSNQVVYCPSVSSTIAPTASSSSQTYSSIGMLVQASTQGGGLAPAVTGLSPSSGPVGTTVTITGSNLGGATSVRFGTTAATGFSVNGSGTQIITTAPAGTGTVDVTVATLLFGTSATSAADRFTYASATPPAVTGVSPVSGTAAGGTAVTISGSNFAGATAVRFGTTAVSSFVVNGTGTQITTTSPAGSGTVDVFVTTPSGTSAVVAADHFTYTSGGGGGGGGTPAAISAVTGLTSVTSAEQTSMADSPAAVGDVLTLAIETKNSGGPVPAVTSVSGGGVATWHQAIAYPGSDATHGYAIWWGAVTTAGSSTISVAYDVASSANTASALDLEEFSSSAGAATVWSLDASGKVDTGVASTTLAYPSLTPSSTSELYYGYLNVPGALSAGSTPGCVYQYDARDNQVVYDTNVSATIAPTAPSSSQTFASIAVLL